MSGSAHWKALQKYLTKAKQIEKIDAAISYYLRMFVIQEAMRLMKQRSPEDTKQLSALLDQVESSKALVKDLSKEDAKLKVETYALNVFDHADNEDRAGKATREVAQAFLSSTILMECTKQFGELSSDIEQKLKYARWRTVEITKALKEGRQPAPPADAGGPMEQDNLPAPGSSLSSSSSSSSSTFSAPGQSFPANGAPAAFPAPSALPSSNSSGSSPLPFIPQSLGSPPSSFPSAPTYNMPLPAPVPSSSLLPPPSSSLSLPSIASPPPAGGYPLPSTHTASLSVGLGNKPVPIPDQPVYRYAPGQPILVYPVDTSVERMTKIQAIKEGERYTKHALSALSFDDINTAIAKMQSALSVLAPYQTEKRK